MQLARPIAEALRRGATIIAASPRAARALQLSYASAERDAGRTVWPSAPITDWDSWLRELWQEHSFSSPDAPMLLSPLQERALWIRAQREDAARVLAPEALAALASRAWALLSTSNAHGVRRQSWGDAQTDVERFRQWAAAFERDCTRNAWLSAGDLATQLTAASASLPLPPEILLVGFDRFTPAQNDFLAALRDRGASVSGFVLPARESRRSWIVAADQRQEVGACALWARDLLLAHPDARIGIIVPGVDSVRGLIDRTFRRILMPASQDILAPAAAMPWEFSLGRPLAEAPAIRAALLLLRWLAGPLPSAEVSWLLLSGFISDTVTHQADVARFLTRRNRAAPLPRQSLSALRDQLAGPRGLPFLHEHLSALLQATASRQLGTAAHPPSVWADLVRFLLDQAGWPGERPADSVQFQAMQQAQRLLDALALLDFDGTCCRFDQFLLQLETHAAESIFSPESLDAPIQIMGPLESAGQHFDAIWFLGADDTGWPMRGHLHPLLPPAVQRHFRMPHATGEDDWNLAHSVTARLLLSAPLLVFSYPQRDQDAELRPSPLIAGLFAGVDPQPAIAPPEPLVSGTLETVADDSGTLPWPGEQNAGGADLLKRQSACPFQAFATRRLAAEPLEDDDWGLSLADRGKLLHDVMQRLYSSDLPAALRTRDDLVTAMVTNQLSGILDAHIDAAIRAILPPEPPDPWLLAWLAAEKRRLRTRIQEWLACEARRHPFTVEACERTLDDVSIGGLRLRLRADRIDLLPDGSRLLLDYKTGEVSAAAWRGDRPGEPQLPLYAACGNVEDVDGLLFAKIRAGNTGFDGRIRDARAQLIPDINPRLALVTDPYSGAMRDAWTRALEALAVEFLNGVATVTPREPQVCRHCPLPALCRKAEHNIAPEPVIDEELDG